mmetsp:Transcript_48488/g.71877  ORF Transcript_48488/g.71877 Transcript_48488/m.71877 type:complete len:229 (+) Transcript_48488:283-969(+)|eukprot:CAMPEP_0195522926 /NCGR_PEP_ID=MMETSP0794_2-20130614/21573_1 /TAXON_ID=515487 /ORGANISM="Stephanopyxis turris, Strain CCMP 815" /LENGTH=228 /DNA_ID=CAMNT_0040652801 /DNA_START=255 /DNA_END=941 /DNA_ORIENTATION=+
MDDLECEVSVLPADSINEAAKVMALAFSDSPAYNFIFQGDLAYRRAALEWVFVRNLSLIHCRNPSAFRGVVDRKADTIMACFLWIPSCDSKLSTWDLVVTAGFWMIPFKFGLSTLKRLLQVIDNENKAKVFFSNSEESDPYVVLERMAVHPDFQGKGLGTKCLRSMISKITVPLRLQTQELRNITFYERLGFRVVGNLKLSENDHEDRYTFTSWFMTRKPATDDVDDE